MAEALLLTVAASAHDSQLFFLSDREPRLPAARESVPSPTADALAVRPARNTCLASRMCASCLDCSCASCMSKGDAEDGADVAGAVAGAASGTGSGAGVTPIPSRKLNSAPGAGGSNV